MIFIQYLGIVPGKSEKLLCHSYNKFNLEGLNILDFKTDCPDNNNMKMHSMPLSYRL